MNPQSNSNDPSMKDETLWQQMRSFPREVWVLFWGMFVNRFGTFVMPFLTIYLGNLGYSAKQIGLVFASMAVGGIVAKVCSGRMTDWIGRKNTMTIALVGGAVATLLMWKSGSLNAFMVSTFLQGLTMGMYPAAANSLLADVVPEERRVTAFAIIRWALNLGFACGMAAGGVLANYNFDLLFIGDAVTSSIYGVLAFFLLPHGIRTSAKSSRWAQALRKMIRNRAFIAFFIANICVSMAYIQCATTIARLTLDLGYTTKVYGWLMAFNGVLITFFEVPMSQFFRKRKAPLVIAFGYFLVCAGVWLNCFATTWVVIGLSVLVFTFGEMMSAPVASAYLVKLSPEKMRGRYSASIGMSWGIANAIGPGLSPGFVSNDARRPVVGNPGIRNLRNVLAVVVSTEGG